MSFLNTTTTTITHSHIPKHITRAQVLTYLHDPNMLYINPVVKSTKLLSDEASIAFYKSVPAADKPAPVEGKEPIIPIYEVIEDMNGAPEEVNTGNWRGGWAKRFIPDELRYESSLEVRDDGMRSICHAAMGVSSVTHWIVKESEDGESVVVEKIGSVTSNRFLMGFIKTTLEESHQKLAKDFVTAVEKYVKGLEGAEKAHETTVEKAT